MEQPKKKYVAPKTEKLEFNYTDIVVASPTGGNRESNPYWECNIEDYQAGWGKDC